MNDEDFQERLEEVQNVQAPDAGIRIEMRSEKDLEDMYEHLYDNGMQVSSLYESRRRKVFFQPTEETIIEYDFQYS